MKFFLLFILIALIIGSVIYIVTTMRKARRREETEETYGATERTPRDPFATEQDTTGDPFKIRAGDMLQFGDDKYFVRGSIHFSEGVYTWHEHFFQADANATRRWLSVEADPDLQMALWQDAPGVSAQAGAAVVTYNNKQFRLDESGQANFTTEGTTGLPQSGVAQYADYESDDGTLLSFEKFGNGAWEVSIGRPLPRGSFTIYPGS